MALTVVAVEGTNGSGKTSTLVELRKLFSKHIDILFTSVHFPGYTEPGLRIREILLNEDLTFDPMAEFLLFAADNRQTWIQMIEPHFSDSLNSDLLIITDRSFMSSAAFQGANGVSEDFITGVSIQQCRYVFYDKFYVLNTPLSVCQQRLHDRGIALDRVERFPQQTQERVCANYDRYIADGRFCGTPVVGIDGTKTTEEITLEIYNDIIATMEKKANA